MKAIFIFLDFFGGNQTKAAKALGKKQGHVHYWMKHSDIPLHLIPQAAKIIGKTPHDLRPDIF